MSPKVKNLSHFFPNVNIKKPLEDAVIEDIRANNEERRIWITVVSKEIIPFEEIERFKTEASEKNSLSELVIKVKYEGLSFENIDIKRYFKNLVFYVSTVCPGVSNLFIDSSCSYSDNRLVIKCKYGINAIEQAKCDKIFEKLIQNQLGKIVKVEIIDTSVEGALEKETEKIEETLEKIVVSDKPKEEESYEIIKAPDKVKKDKSECVTRDNVILGHVIKSEPIKIKELLKVTTGSAVVRGEIFEYEARELKTGKYVITFAITDKTGSYMAKLFLTAEEYTEKVKGNIKDGMYLELQGQVKYDTFMKEMVLNVRDINKRSKEEKMDLADEKRVELHLHTKMSAMDGMTSAKDLVKTAIKWGHKAVAITDHGNVQAFPEAMGAVGDSGIKILYGIEAYIVGDSLPIVFNTKEQSLDGEFVVFDIETTGLNPVNDTITEIGAVKVKNGEIVDTFQTFVNPEKPIPQNIVELTGITDQMVADAPTIDVVIKDFYEFIGDASLVAHNAGFDTSFIKVASQKNNMEFNFCYIDTVEMSRALLKDVKNHKLNTITKHLNITLENHHRAIDDATATGYVFIRFLNMIKEKGVTDVSEINTGLCVNADFKNQRTYHAIILVQNYTGLKNLYNIVSKSNMDYYYKRPRLPKSLLEKNREGLLLGSACEAGELYRAILEGEKFETLNRIAKFYDYLEIQPLGNNEFLLEEGKVTSYEDLRNINKKIIDLGKKNGKLTVATCDVHFLNPEDEVYRRILMAGQGFTDADNQAPLYFRTTDEMLEEFKYLGDDVAYEVVVENTNKIADMCEFIKPVPDGTAPPEIPGADEELREMVMNKAKRIYGENLPQLVKDRIDVELSSIIDNGYAVMYIIAQKLVTKSLSDGYLVGSRGSVGSSFVAFLSDITEVNSLPPHYVCPNCQYSDFDVADGIFCGFDMDDKNCPHCNTPMIKDGHDIPFETFLGFGGGKEPDIDLNFSGDYQPRAHKYTEELFGEGYVFRAGTIGTIASKTAYGFVKKYYEAKGEHINNAEVNRLVKGCEGVKRTTGQHPGGVMIVPRSRDVLEFTPIQYPADDKDSGVITTHFDYHSISGKLLKLDILGHDDPTVIRMLEDLTHTNAREIPPGDKETMALFGSTKSLGVKPEDIYSEVGTYAVPEFGTKFVRQMLVDTKPTTFAELVRISGLSHGTDVWINNAQELINNGTATLKEAICTRDDIMLYLIKCGLDPKVSFYTMENVRKGKGLKPDQEEAMIENNVPQWYIDSCKKIKYMFPKAHAVAYVTMAYRIAYYKVHYPMEFYCTYFTVRADDFDASIMAQGHEVAKRALLDLRARENELSVKEKGVLTILEVCNEMYARGLKFLPIDIAKSEAFKFLPTPDGILPPLNSLVGLGTNAAKSIVDARNERMFDTIDDLTARSSVTKTVVETLKNHGCLKGLPESDQITFF